MFPCPSPIELCGQHFDLCHMARFDLPFALRHLPCERHANIGLGSTATRQAPASPLFLSSAHFDQAGERLPSIVPRGGIRRLLTCSSFLPRNAHGTRHDMCHFSAIPHYLSQGHLHLAGIPPPSISTTWCDPVSFRKIISYRQILPLTSHISDRPEIGPTTRPLPS